MSQNMFCKNRLTKISPV